MLVLECLNTLVVVLFQCLEFLVPVIIEFLKGSLLMDFKSLQVILLLSQQSIQLILTILELKFFNSLFCGIGLCEISFSFIVNSLFLKLAQHFFELTTFLVLISIFLGTICAWHIYIFSNKILYYFLFRFLYLINFVCG